MVGIFASGVGGLRNSRLVGDETLGTHDSHHHGGKDAGHV